MMLEQDVAFTMLMVEWKMRNLRRLRESLEAATREMGRRDTEEATRELLREIERV